MYLDAQMNHEGVVSYDKDGVPRRTRHVLTRPESVKTLPLWSSETPALNQSVPIEQSKRNHILIMDEGIFELDSWLSLDSDAVAQHCTLSPRCPISQ